MQWIKFVLRLQFRIFEKLVYVILPQSTRKQVQRIGVKYWLQLFFIQRILRINSQVPWPCHWSSVVNNSKKIYMKTFPPFPGLGPGQYIQALNGIHIGSNVRMGPGVKLISGNHNLEDYEQHVFAEPIVIGDFCWLGADAIILPGVKLGNHVIVGAGAVVTKSLRASHFLEVGH